MPLRPRSVFIVALMLLAGCAGESIRRAQTLDGRHQDRASHQIMSATYETIPMESGADRALSSVPLSPPNDVQEPSFCKLNPGACWPPLPTPETGEPEATADPWKSFACMQACDAGGAAMEKFCDALPNRTRRQKKLRALCWGISTGSKAACRVFCRGYFGPPRTP
jgi:hypothetical protein